MKNIIAIILSLALLLALSLTTSCVKMKFDDIENNSGSQFELPENALVMTVEMFKGAFPENIRQIPYPYIDEFSGDTVEVYLYVQVIGNDMSGNLYKNIYVRDASVDNGQAINISVDKTGLYNFYPVGQKMYIRCSGLYIGRYNGLPQLGYIYNGGIGRMADALFDSHVHKDGQVPNKESLPKPMEIYRGSDLKIELLNQLVILKNVRFKIDHVGLQFSDPTPVGENPISTDRVMILEDGTELNLRTSSACRFYSYSIPDSVGDVTCMYTVYGGIPQMYMRSYADINPNHGFKWDVPPYNVSRDTLLNVPFSSELSPFTPVSVLGDAEWVIGTQSGYYALMRGRNGDQNEANEDWLISPKIDLQSLSYDDLKLSFNQALNYQNGQAWDNFALRVSSDYDPAIHSNPNSATWQTVGMANLPNGSSFNFVTTSSDLKSYIGKSVSIAFVYKSTESNAASWEIKNLFLVGESINK